MKLSPFRARATYLLSSALLLACGSGLDDLSSGTAAGAGGEASGGRGGGGASGSAGNGASGATAGRAGATSGAGGSGASAGAGGSGGVGASAGAAAGTTAAGGGGTKAVGGAGGSVAGAGGTSTAGAGGQGTAGSGAGGTGAGAAGQSAGGAASGGAGSGGASAGTGGTGVGGAAGGGGASPGGSGGVAGAGTSGGGGSAGQAGASCMPPTGALDCDGISKDDNCPNLTNLDQSDQDGDGMGDACDSSPGGPDGTTTFGKCNNMSTPAIVLTSVLPASVCPGDTIEVAYQAALKFNACLLPNPLVFNLFVSGVGNPGGTFGQNGTSIGSEGIAATTKQIQLSKTLASNDYFLEISSPLATGTPVRSRRLPLTVGGKGVTASLTIAGPILRERSPAMAKLTLTPGTAYRVLLGGSEIATGTGPASGEVSVAVPFNQVETSSVIVEMAAPDGCTVQRSFSFDVLTCNPKLEASTQLSSENDLTSNNLWVCGGTTYNGTSRNVYMQATGTFGGKASAGGGTMWAPEGATIGPTLSGTWTILHTGVPPMVPLGPAVTLVACPSMTFDTAAVTDKCP